MSVTFVVAELGLVVAAVSDVAEPAVELAVSVVVVVVVVVVAAAADQVVTWVLKIPSLEN